MLNATGPETELGTLAQSDSHNVRVSNFYANYTVLKLLNAKITGLIDKIVFQ